MIVHDLPTIYYFTYYFTIVNRKRALRNHTMLILSRHHRISGLQPFHIKRMEFHHRLWYNARYNKLEDF